METPTFASTRTASSFTYTTQRGTWSRYGGLVALWFELRLSPIPTAATGQIIITGLPFLVQQRAGVTWGFLQSVPAAATGEVLDTNPARIALYSGNVSWGPSNLTTSTYLIGSAVYVPMS